MLVSWKVPSIPEGHGGDPAHEGVGRDTLQVEKEAVCQQQQHHVLAVAEAPPAPPDYWQVLSGVRATCCCARFLRPPPWTSPGKELTLPRALQTASRGASEPRWSKLHADKSQGQQARDRAPTITNVRETPIKATRYQLAPIGTASVKKPRGLLAGQRLGLGAFMAVARVQALVGN